MLSAAGITCLITIPFMLSARRKSKTDLRESPERRRIDYSRPRRGRNIAVRPFILLREIAIWQAPSKVPEVRGARETWSEREKDYLAAFTALEGKKGVGGVARHGGVWKYERS